MSDDNMKLSFNESAFHKWYDQTIKSKGDHNL